MPITHSFVSEKPDDPDATLVRASDWNADHVIAPGDVRDIGRWEVLMTPGVTNPPEQLTNEAGDDWLYVWVTG